ncbi:MAG: hypothetical protein ACK4M2_00230 [Brevundimonas sp.]
MRAAAAAGLLLASGAASAVIAQTAASPSPSLTTSIREAVARARAGSAGDPQETTIATTLADIIVTANVQPAEALASVRLAIAEEGCVFEAESWNRWGCAGLSNVASSIQQAIGSGPAATIGEGGVATPPPSAAPGGGGADYRAPVGG